MNKLRTIILHILDAISNLISLLFFRNIIAVIKRIRSSTIMYSAKRHYERKLKSCGEAVRIAEPAYTLGLEHISIGNNFNAAHDFTIEAYDHYLSQTFQPRITIGDNVTIAAYCHIGCINEICIGDDVLIAGKVYISDHFHGRTNAESIKRRPVFRDLFSKGPVRIERKVWIGEGASIMPNVTIGENSIIGANSVVTKNVPANCVAAGNPAKIIKWFYKSTQRRIIND